MSYITINEEIPGMIVSTSLHDIDNRLAGIHNSYKDIFGEHIEFIDNAECIEKFTDTGNFIEIDKRYEEYLLIVNQIIREEDQKDILEKIKKDLKERTIIIPLRLYFIKVVFHGILDQIDTLKINLGNIEGTDDSFRESYNKKVEQEAIYRSKVILYHHEEKYYFKKKKMFDNFKKNLIRISDSYDRNNMREASKLLEAWRNVFYGIKNSKDENTHQRIKEVSEDIIYHDDREKPQDSLFDLLIIYKIFLDKTPLFILTDEFSNYYFGKSQDMLVTFDHTENPYSGAYLKDLMKWDVNLLNEEKKNTYQILIDKVDEEINNDIQNKQDTFEKIIQRMNSLIYTSLGKFKRVEFRITSRNQTLDNLELSVIENDIKERHTVELALKRLLQVDKLQTMTTVEKITTLVGKIKL